MLRRTMGLKKQFALTLINVKHLTNDSVLFFPHTFFCGFQRVKNNNLSYRMLHPSYEYFIKDLVK